MNIIRLLRQDLIRLSEDYEQKIPSVQYWKIIHPKFFPVILIRLSRSLYQSVWLRPLSHILVLVNLIIFGIEVTPRCSIGGGLFLPHTSGTVIGAVSIGENGCSFPLTCAPMPTRPGRMMPSRRSLPANMQRTGMRIPGPRPRSSSACCSRSSRRRAARREPADPKGPPARTANTRNDDAKD